MRLDAYKRPKKILRAATARLAGRAYLPAQFLNVASQLRHTAEAARQAVQQAPMEFAVRGGQFVVHPEPLLACADKTGFPKICQVARHLRLRQVEHADNVTHT